MNSVKAAEWSNFDALLRRVKENVGGAANDGRILNDLLHKLHNGYPTQSLLGLLEASDISTIRAAAWLLSELGTGACNLRTSIWPLLEFADARVRFSAIDCVVVCAGCDDGEIIARLFGLLSDADGSVRWKALDAVVKLSNEQIEAGCDWLKRNQLYSPSANIFMLLCDSAEDAICEHLSKAEAGQINSKMQRKVVFAAAIRRKCSVERLRVLANLLEDYDLIDFLDDFV